MVTESLDHAILAKESSQPQSSYEAAATLTEFELKKILIDKMDKNKTLFSTYDKVYSLKRSRKDKDKDEDPFAGSDRGLKKRKTSKDAEPTKGPKAKESQYCSSKGTKSQPKSSGKSVQSEEPEFEVADSDMPQDQEGNLDNDNEEPMKETISKCDWFTKPTQPQEPTDPDWNVGKTPQQGQTQSWLMTLASSADKQLLKSTHSNYAELEYDFEECYKALSEKLDWENPKGGDYPFDLTKPLPLVMSGNRQKVHVDYFFNNDLKYLQGGVSTMTYTTSITKTKAAQYDLPGIKDMVLNIWVPVKVAYDKHAVEVMRKHGYGYLKEIVVTRANNDLYTFKEGDFPRLRINDIEDMLLLVVQNRLINLSGDDVFDFTIALRMFTRSLVIQKRVEDLQLGFSDRTLTGLRTLLNDITKNIRMEYLPNRRWSTLDKKRANIMIKVIDKQLKERRMMRSLKKFVGGRHYGTDLWLLQRTI
ncbi:hypothetical protein Tco_1107626 [Tanacetum coccineum]